MHLLSARSTPSTMKFVEATACSVTLASYAQWSISETSTIRRWWALTQRRSLGYSTKKRMLTSIFTTYVLWTLFLPETGFVSGFEICLSATSVTDWIESELWKGLLEPWTSSWKRWFERIGGRNPTIRSSELHPAQSTQTSQDTFGCHRTTEMTWQHRHHQTK